VSSIKPDHAGSKMDGAEEVACGLIITCGDRTKLLESGKEVLDQVPRRVQMTVELPGLLTIGPRRDHRGFSGDGQRMDFSAQSAARPPDRLIRAVFFWAPALC
jgi:hypothetical protein